MNKKLALVLILTAVLSGCMKTRSQVKDGAPEDDSTETESSNMPAYKGGRHDLEEMKNEITRIAGKLEELEHRAGGAGAGTQSPDKNDARIAELEKNQTILFTEIKALKDGGTVQMKAANTPNPALLEEAETLLEDKKFDEAEDKFKIILGKTAKGPEAAQAAFGLGEAQYAQKKYKDAILSYSKVQEAHAKSPRIAESMYRIGLSFQHMNMQSEANNFFKVILEKYPKSPEAKKAKARLKE